MRKGDVFLSAKEARRVYVMEQVVARTVTASQAAALLGVTRRHVFRWKRGMKTTGVAALAHKNRGRAPAHALDATTRKTIVDVGRQAYLGASYRHMAELLADHHRIHVSPKTIGRILTHAGVANPHRHRPPRRHRSRDRMPQAGLLVQIDASPHAWLEGRGPRLSLHGGIDDATSTIVGLHFRPTEDLLGYVTVLEQMIRTVGIPHALYSDRHTIFLSPNTDKLSVAEEFAGATVALTQFGKALQALEIRHIPARSPQAKGRIERLWGTLQHRLLIELRVAGVTTLDAANAFLPGFITRFNQRFAVPAADAHLAYRPKPARARLERILCQRHARVADRGSTISFGGHTYHLVTRKKTVLPVRPKDVVTVLVHRDGHLSALYHGTPYRLKAFTKPTPTGATTPKAPRPIVVPAPNHPWRRSFKTQPPKGVTVSLSH